MPEWTLSARAESVPLARRLAIEAMAGVPPDVRTTAALLVSELVTNCIRHAGTDVHLKVTCDSADVRVEVTDQGDGVPTPMHPTPAEPHGRGLHIVEQLARRWGIVPSVRGPGKTVWFSVTAASRPLPAGAQA